MESTSSLYATFHILDPYVWKLTNKHLTFCYSCDVVPSFLTMRGICEDKNFFARFVVDQDQIDSKINFRLVEL